MIRVDTTGTILVEPAQFLRTHQKNSPQHQLGDPFRVCLGIDQRQRAAPRAAEYLPALDIEVIAKRLNIADQISRRIMFQAGMRPALASTALVK